LENETATTGCLPHDAVVSDDISGHSGPVMLRCLPVSSREASVDGLRGYLIGRTDLVRQRRIIDEMVAQIFPRWNPLTSWMRQIEDFQRAA
jgi:hypothetical protein